MRTSALTTLRACTGRRPVLVVPRTRSRRASTTVCLRTKSDDPAESTPGRILKASTAHELLIGASHVFDDAERQLRDHCNSLLPTDSSSDIDDDTRRAERCNSVLSELQHRREEAVTGCVREDGGGGGGGGEMSCRQLERLELLLRELAYSGGGAEDLYRVLAIQMAPSPAAGARSDTAAAPALLSAVDESKARRLFEAADATHRGALDKEQLLWALSAMGRPMTHPEVNRALAALDVHGFVPCDTFLGILGALAVVGAAPGSPTDAAFLRGVGHQKPSWYSDTPHAIDAMW